MTESSHLELMVHNTFLHVFERKDDEFDFVRTQSEPASGKPFAIPREQSGMPTNMQDVRDGKISTSSARWMQKSPQQKDLPDQSEVAEPAKTKNDNTERPLEARIAVTQVPLVKSGHQPCRSHRANTVIRSSDKDLSDVSSFCHRTSSPISTTSTSASSDEFSCDKPDSTGNMQAPISRQIIMPVFGAVPARIGDPAAMNGPPQISMGVETMVHIPAATCQLASAPSCFVGVAGPNIERVMAADRNFFKPSGPCIAQHARQCPGNMGASNVMHMAVAMPGIPPTARSHMTSGGNSSLPGQIPSQATPTELPIRVMPQPATQTTHGFLATSGVQSTTSSAINASQNAFMSIKLCESLTPTQEVKQEDPAADLTFGCQHRFHDESRAMGWLSADGRMFTKRHYGGRLSIVTENKVHHSGILKYAVQFTAGDMSSADGVDFIFSPKLPSTKNIQQIVSIFANSAGRICLRAGAEVVRSRMSLPRLELGSWIILDLDLEEQVACFKTISSLDSKLIAQVSLAFGSILKRLKDQSSLVPQVPCGYFACVVKNLGVSVKLGS